VILVYDIDADKESIEESIEVNIGVLDKDKYKEKKLQLE